MSHMVICSVCGKKFDRDKEPFVQTSARRYAHELCVLSKDQKEQKELSDKEKLENYIMKLFKEDYINPRIRKQMNEFVTKYGYTYSGMLKALNYFYEIKGNSIEKSNGGIGIIPYVYKDAYNYYYALWMAQEVNKEKDVGLFVPQIREIKIKNPQRKINKRNYFSFLDEEEVISDGE